MLQRGHLSEVVGAGTELNVQNLNPRGGFIDKELSRMKKLARHTKPPLPDNAFIVSTTRRPRVSLDH
jgi:hypothetical protein